MSGVARHPECELVVSTRFKSHLTLIANRLRNRAAKRAALALFIGCATAIVTSLQVAMKRSERTTERLNTAAIRLDAFTGGAPGDDQRRAAIAWGYAERLRLGLESPFRLVEAAGRDPRLTVEERRTVSWALLAHIGRGEAHQVDPAVLDGIGPVDGNRLVPGEQHVALIDSVVARAKNPRSAELAIRFAYTLAVAERVVEASAPILAAEAAALAADREIARREAGAMVRSLRGTDPVEVVRRRREQRAFYVERPMLLAPTSEIEDEAMAMTPALLAIVRAMRVGSEHADLSARSDVDITAIALAPRLYAAGALVPPSAPLAVTVQRYEPMMRAQGGGARVDEQALARARNAEMLVGATRVADATRAQRRVVGRLILAAAVAMRSVSQEPVWFPVDSAPSELDLAKRLGAADIVFDHDVPTVWRPYYARQLDVAVRDLRRVLPALSLDALHIRFRMHSPSDSALALHDPRSRTLHLPVLTAGGTLSHELAHDLDRRMALQRGLAGYQSDLVARVQTKDGTRGSTTARLAASLRALTEELSEAPFTTNARPERPAEIFATRVDWFVAQALARQGLSSGFLSAAQDELLTGHVIHPERLRGSSRSRSLLTALEAMTVVAPFAQIDEAPSAQTLLRWSLAGAVDRRAAADIVHSGDQRSWQTPTLLGGGNCTNDVSARAGLIRLAAESRARGWLRSRARWTPDAERSPWARAMLRQSPWSDALAEARVAVLRDFILVQLASGVELPAGLSAYASPLARRARCER